MTNKSDLSDLKYLDDIFKEFSISFRESFKNLITNEGYVKYTVEKNIIPQAGNFLSISYEVNITGETADRKKVTSLFVKKAVIFEKITLSDVSDLYSREILVYNELSRIFSRLQDSADIPDRERYRFIKSYDSDEETVIMENISSEGYKCRDGKQVMTIQFAEFSIIELAKFHALSYVLKMKLPQYFDDKIKAIKQSYNLNSDWNGFINNVCAATAQVMDIDTKDKIKNYSPRMLQIFKKYMKDQNTNGCLCHGDYKILNILVKEIDGDISEVLPIDYQLVYYGNPVNDIMFFIYTGTDREFRRKYLSYLKDLYFESFAKFLSYFNLDVDSTYSRQEFEKDYEERLELGLGIGLYMTAFTFAHIGEDFDVTKQSLTELTIVPDEMFRDRVRGVVEDYIEWGIL